MISDLFYASQVIFLRFGSHFYCIVAFSLSRHHHLKCCKNLVTLRVYLPAVCIFSSRKMGTDMPKSAGVTPKPTTPSWGRLVSCWLRMTSSIWSSRLPAFLCRGTVRDMSWSLPVWLRSSGTSCQPPSWTSPSTRSSETSPVKYLYHCGVVASRASSRACPCWWPTWPTSPTARCPTPTWSPSSVRRRTGRTPPGDAGKG